jgi:hypothetical protein
MCGLYRSQLLYHASYGLAHRHPETMFNLSSPAKFPPRAATRIPSRRWHSATHLGTTGAERNGSEPP